MSEHSPLKRSNAPIFWLLFGAGGMLSALFGSALVFITGLALPLGWPFSGELLSYPRMLNLAHHPLGKLYLLAIVTLFAWHAGHRILCSLHDLGIHKGFFAKLGCYGAAFALSLLAAGSLLRIGF